MDSTSHDEHSAAPSEASDATGDPTDAASPSLLRRRRSRSGKGVKRWSRRRRIVVSLSTVVTTTALALGTDVAVLVHRPARVDIAMPSTSGKPLAQTGANGLLFGGIAAALVAIGGGALVVRRRKA